MTDHKAAQDAADRAELHSLMETLGLYNAAFASLVGVARSTPATWLEGTTAVPQWALEYLRLLAALRAICGRRFNAGAVSKDLPQRLQPYRWSENEVEYAENDDVTKQTQGQSGTLSSEMATQTPFAMTPAEFGSTLKQLRWKQADFVRRVGVAPATASRWAGGTQPIPGWVNAYLSLVQEVDALQTLIRPDRDRKPRSGL